MRLLSKLLSAIYGSTVLWRSLTFHPISVTKYGWFNQAWYFGIIWYFWTLYCNFEIKILFHFWLNNNILSFYFFVLCVKPKISEEFWSKAFKLYIIVWNMYISSVRNVDNFVLIFSPKISVSKFFKSCKLFFWRLIICFFIETEFALFESNEYVERNKFSLITVRFLLVTKFLNTCATWGRNVRMS